MLSLSLVRHELFIAKREGWRWSMVSPSYPHLPSPLPKCPYPQGGICASTRELHQTSPFVFMAFGMSKVGDVFETVLIQADSRIRPGRKTFWVSLLSQLEGCIVAYGIYSMLSSGLSMHFQRIILFKTFLPVLFNCTYSFCLAGELSMLKARYS